MLNLMSSNGMWLDLVKQSHQTPTSTMTIIHVKIVSVSLRLLFMLMPLSLVVGIVVIKASHVKYQVNVEGPLEEGCVFEIKSFDGFSFQFFYIFR